MTSTPPPPRTAHFNLIEWEQRCDAPPEVWPAIQRIMDVLEAVRGAVRIIYPGATCTITPAGGYRTALLNASNPGRAKRSRHMVGDAADTVWRTQDGTRIPTQWVFALVDEWQRTGWVTPGGLKAYRTFVHIDARGKIARW